jgi:hypothetical protein
MSNKKQILHAFFIPFFLAVGLLVLRIFVFYDQCDPWLSNKGIFQCGLSDYEIPLQLRIIQLSIPGLFVLSFILPSFVMMRMYQNRRNKLESGSIIE